jgi:O-antigen ligase
MIANGSSSSHRIMPEWVLPFTATLMVGGVFVVISDETVTWMALFLMALCATAFAFLNGDFKRLLLFFFVMALPIDMSKALIAEGGVYTPGLSLYLCDIPLFSLTLLLLAEHVFVKRSRFPTLTRMDKIACIYVAWLWISVLHSERQLIGFFSALSYSKYVLVYFIISRTVNSYAEIRLVLAAVFATFMIQLVYVAAQLAAGSPLDLQGAKATSLGTRLVYDAAEGMAAFRPSGFLRHPNVLADYLTFLLPVALIFSLLGKRWLPPKVWLASLFMLVAGVGMLVVTLSRGGWIAFGVAALVVVAIGLKRGLVGQIHITLGVVGIASAISIVSIAYPQAILRLTQSDSRSTESRVVMNQQALLIIRSNPLLGVGYGGYNNAAQTYIPEAFSSVSKAFQEEIQKGVAHNYYLLTASEIGIPAMLFWIYMVVGFIRQAFPLNQWRSPPMFALAVGLACSLVAQLCFHLFDHFYGDVRIEMLWVTSGLLLAARQIEKNARLVPTPQRSFR